MTAQSEVQTTPVSGPLAGIRVLDLTQFILGPVATQILGDMGADVIKIEPPQGDQNRYIGPGPCKAMAALYLGMNRNKRSVVLDLKRRAALEVLMTMAEHADVFVHSLRPDTADRLGISYSDIAARNPKIVYASAPGYRSDGPLRNRPAYDDVIQGESGIVDLNLRAHGEPRYLPTVIADKFCGYVLASSIGIALFHRARTGEGQAVEVPMLETMLSFNLIEHLWTGNYGDPMGPLGYDRALMPSRRPFATSDGHICLMATTDVQWQRLFKAIDRPELGGDPRFATINARSQWFPELYRLMAESIVTRTTAEWRHRLDAADIPNAAVRRLADMPTDPYLVETKFFHHYQHPEAGPLITTAIPVQFSKTPPTVRMPPPRLGEHTKEVLAEFGFSDAKIAEVV